MAIVNLRRDEAENMIESIRKMLADGASAAQVESMLRTVYRIDPLQKCTGEAHSNPYVDNCGACAPRWGQTGSFVTVARVQRRKSPKSAV